MRGTRGRRRGTARGRGWELVRAPRAQLHLHAQPPHLLKHDEDSVFPALDVVQQFRRVEVGERTLPVPGLPASMMCRSSRGAPSCRTSPPRRGTSSSCPPRRRRKRGDAARAPARARAHAQSESRPRTGRAVAGARDAAALLASRAGATARGAPRARARGFARGGHPSRGPPSGRARRSRGWRRGVTR